MRILDKSSVFRTLGTLGFAVFAAGAVTACDEDPPPPAAGAFNIAFVSGSEPSKCQIQTHAAVLGVVGTNGTPDTIPADANTAVKCSVIKNGANFGVTVNASSNGYTFGAKVAAFSPSATFDAPVAGTVSYTSPQTQDNFVSTDCQFWLVPENGQFVKDGSTWFTFSCPTMTSEGRVCALNPSFVKFENCDSLVEDEEE